MTWNANDDLFFFHATNSDALVKEYIIPPSKNMKLKDKSGNDFRPDLNKCRWNTDFGRGFYVTSSLRQAKEWANEIVRKSIAKGSITSQAIVLRFDLDREKISVSDTHSFVGETVDYYSFTDRWRGAIPYTPPHGRTKSNPTYDFVHGPVRLNRQHIILQNCDQLSLHTPKAFAAIRDVLLEDIAAPGTATTPSAFSYP